MSTALIPYSDLERMAQSIVKSELFGYKSVDQAISLMLIAQAEEKHPAIIARDYHIIKGRPSKKSEAMLRDFLQSGGRVTWHALDDTIADATFSHPQGGEVRITWDIPRAQKAGLLGREGDMYGKYPRPMLRSRCVSEGVRTVAPFATSGVLTPEEVKDIAAAVAAVDDVSGIKDVTPERPTKLEEGAIADHLAAIEAAADLDELKRAFQTAYSAAKQAGDFSAVEKFEKAKDSRKRNLTAEDVQP